MLTILPSEVKGLENTFEYLAEENGRRLGCCRFFVNGSKLEIISFDFETDKLPEAEITFKAILRFGTGKNVFTIECENNETNRKYFLEFGMRPKENLLYAEIPDLLFSI